jgi:hypothetical protein
MAGGTGGVDGVATWVGVSSETVLGLELVALGRWYQDVDI